MKKVIFFDLDGTLIEENSWYAFNLYFGMSETEDQTLLNWYSRGIITYDEWDKIIVKILRDKNQCTLEKVNEFVKTIVPRPEVIDLIKACKEKGYTTIILSGTMKQIAENFRERVGIDLSYTTSEIMFSDEGAFETINNEKDEGLAKLRIYEKLCEEHGVNPEEVLYVGDSRNDLEIFQKTKKGILIGNYEKLKPFAARQITNLNEVIELL
jgi:HAD superfamily phosphoserine phosphatase-like hydrolase